MSVLKDFKIQITGLKLKKYLFEYHLKESFFKNFEHSQISVADIKVSIELEKKEDMYLLDFKINGTYNKDCDLCLEKVDVPVSTDLNIIYKYSSVERESEFNGETELIYIDYSATELNITDIIYQAIHLEIPLKITCDLSEKDTNCTFEYENEEEEKGSEEIDPRWAALKKLTNKDK